MVIGNVAASQPLRPASRRDLYALKEVLERLYQLYSVKEVGEKMKEYGIYATTRQLQKAFQNWKTRKYISKDNKDYMVGIHQARERKGKKTYFRYNGRPYTLPMIQRHIREQNLDEAGLNSLEVRAAAQERPEEIDFGTPEPDCNSVTETGEAHGEFPSSPSTLVSSSDRSSSPLSPESSTSFTASSMSSNTVFGSPRIPRGTWFKGKSPAPMDQNIPLPMLHSLQADPMSQVLTVNGPQVRIQEPTVQAPLRYRYNDEHRVELELRNSVIRLGKYHVDTLSKMNELGSIFVDQGRFRAAEVMFVQSILGLMKAPNTHYRGTHYESILETLERLGELLQCQGLYVRAEELQKNILGSKQRTLGEDHLLTLTCMTNLSITYKHEERWKEAEELDFQVLEQRKIQLGMLHEDTLASMGNLATTYRNQNRWEEAERLETYVMNAFQSREQGEKNPDTLISMTNLASTYSGEERWLEAEALGIKAVEGFKKVQGDEHPDTLSSMSSLAKTYDSEGKWLEAHGRLMEAEARWMKAEALDVEVITRRAKVLGQKHTRTLATVAHLASTHRNRRKWKEAERLGAGLIGVLTKTRGPEHPQTREEKMNLASVCRNQGRHGEAERLEKEATGTREIFAVPANWIQFDQV